MDEATQNYYVEHRPTWLERFWRALGYRGAYPDAPAEWEEQYQHWMMTNVDVHVSIADRFRLLLSGHVLVRIETRSKHDPGAVASASAFQVLPPLGER